VHTVCGRTLDLGADGARPSSTPARSTPRVSAGSWSRSCPTVTWWSSSRPRSTPWSRQRRTRHEHAGLHGQRRDRARGTL